MSAWVQEQTERLGPNHQDDELLQTEQCLHEVRKTKLLVFFVIRSVLVTILILFFLSPRIHCYLKVAWLEVCHLRSANWSTLTCCYHFLYCFIVDRGSTQNCRKNNKDPTSCWRSGTEHQRTHSQNWFRLVGLHIALAISRSRLWNPSVPLVKFEPSKDVHLQEEFCLLYLTHTHWMWLNRSGNGSNLMKNVLSIECFSSLWTVEES